MGFVLDIEHLKHFEQGGSVSNFNVEGLIIALIS